NGLKNTKNTLFITININQTMKNIKVSNCQECPFCNNDNEYGQDKCNLDSEIYAKTNEELPSDKVHENCPLVSDNVLVLLINDCKCTYQTLFNNESVKVTECDYCKSKNP